MSLVALHPVPAGAEMYQLTAPDGTQHYTNAPTDPRYQRMGFLLRHGRRLAATAAGRSGRYASEIQDAAERYQVPIKLVSAVIRVESGFNPKAVSPKGAQGLMQLMPQTASILGVRNSFDPRENIDGGVRHLRALIDRFPHSLSLAIAAYNAGERAVAQYGEIPPYPETQDYVAKVMRFYGGVEGGTTPPTRIYQTVGADGTVTYTNIPPRGRPSSLALPHEIEEALQQAVAHERSPPPPSSTPDPYPRARRACPRRPSARRRPDRGPRPPAGRRRSASVNALTAGPPMAMAGKNSPSSWFISHTSVTTTAVRRSLPLARTVISRLRS